MKTIKKIFALVCILLFSSYSAKVKAQNYSIVYNNTSNCHWQITLYTSGAIPILSDNAIGLSSTVSCSNTLLTSLVASYVQIYNTWTSCMVTFPIGPGTQTGISTYCGLQCTAANTTETISVSWAPVTCGGPYNEITVTITP